ncbi:hypothetical protein [Sphingopyxis alaskensis]|uniref:hypothetical protein n=1 Tax=Sphingopyxis alaskensis TaxID=117207 RepID=UPI00203FDB04|nr:hypothetical protein [Sphingopyxis alaskensis]MCM3421276.1 hypothetical protein [Sphingopyxis alaskensis]
MHTLSPLRAQLASFEHAYTLATRLRQATGRDHYLVRSGNPLQPIHVTATRPPDRKRVLAWIL